MTTHRFALLVSVAVALTGCRRGASDPDPVGSTPPAPTSPTTTDTQATDTDTDTTSTTGTGDTHTGTVLPTSTTGATGETGHTGVPQTGVLRFTGDPPKNLLFLSIDTFRKDHLGAYGNLGLTPFLDTLSDAGVVLENHVQCSNWTWGSTTCTLAGRTAAESNHLPRLNGATHQKVPVPAGTPFLAGWLGDAGFFSVLSCSNSWFSSTWGNTQGYDVEIRSGGGALTIGRDGKNALLDAMARGEVTDRWFLHVHVLDPHASYNPTEEYVEGIDKLEPWPEDLTVRPNHYDARDAWPSMTADEQALLEAHLRALYAGEIRRLDERFETLWAELQKDGLLDDTLVVIWNDHGEQFWEHGEQTHAYRLEGEENDGVMVFWADNIIPGRHEGYTSAVDLVPTLLDLYGQPIPPETTGYVLGEAPVGRPIFADALGRRGGQQSITVDGLKLTYAWAGRVQMFDRTVDPTEQVDLYDPTDPRVLDLWAQLKPKVDAMALLPIDGPVPVYPADLP